MKVAMEGNTAEEGNNAEDKKLVDYSDSITNNSALDVSQYLRLFTQINRII
jgi:hypothetical protein